MANIWPRGSQISSLKKYLHEYKYMRTAAMSILYLMNNLLISKIYLSVPQCP